MSEKILIAVLSLFGASLMFAFGDPLPPAGATHNPHFVGESFDYGEWTMDIDVATNKVASESGQAFTLVFFSGALWCPWCLGWEQDVLDNAAFLEFARTNNIALVMIDNPKRDGTPPTLLRSAVYSGASNDERNGSSGAAYLEAHGILPEVAEAVLSRNAALQAAWTTPDATRIGYPTMVLLRQDGSIAGRFSGAYRTTNPNSVPPRHTFDLGTNMLRFSEFLDMARDASESGEERNDYVAWTGDELSVTDEKTASLRAMDTVDVYRLETEAHTRPVVAVRGAEDANIQLALLDAAGRTVKTQNGSLLTGVTLMADNAVTGVLHYVSVTASGAAVAVLSSESTVRAYTVTTSKINMPGVVGFAASAMTVSRDSTTATVTLRRTGGVWGAQSMKINIDASATTAVTGEDFTDVFGADGVIVTWLAGEGGDKTIDIPLFPSEVDGVSKTIALKVTEWVEGEGTGPAPDRCVLTLSGSDYPFFGQETAAFEARTRVTMDVTVAVLNTAGGKITVSRKSGSLPSGVKASYDASAGGMCLTGVPKKTGEYTAVFQVSEKRGSKTVAGGMVSVSVTVGELMDVNPVAAQAMTAAEGPAVDSLTGRVVGVVRFSISKTGRMTAKYRGVDGNDSLTASAWATVLANGRTEAFLASRKRVLFVALGAEGTVVESYLQALPVNGGSSPQYGVLLATVPWTKDIPASAYQGRYTASLSPEEKRGLWAPDGYSTLTLSLPASAVRNGTMKFAGTLADGAKYSGSALLAPYDGESGDQAHLAVYAKAKKAYVGAFLAVDAYASETYQDWPSAISVCDDDIVPYWTKEGDTPETSFDMTLGICGGYYNPADSLIEYWEKYEELYGPFQLRADGVPPVSVYGVATNLPLIDLAVTEKTLKIPSKGVNPTKATLVLNKTTGVVRGTFRIPFENAEGNVRTIKASYSGVLLPGWTGDCGCSRDDDELPEQPFAMGAFQFSDKMDVSVDGKAKTVTLKQGHPIIIKKALDAVDP